MAFEEGTGDGGGGVKGKRSADEMHKIGLKPTPGDRPTPINQSKVWLD